MAETGLTGVRAPAAVRGRGGFRRLMISLGLASGALSGLYGGIGFILLPQQIENIDRAHKVAALGVVSGVAACFALVFNPIGGALSDRTRSRFGRRNPWLVAGAVGMLVMLAILGQADTVLAVLLIWCVAQAVANFYQAPLTAIIPDRVPRPRRGVASAVTGVAQVVGGVIGVEIASLFTHRLAGGYLVLGVIMAATAIGLVLATADPGTGGPGTGDPGTGDAPTDDLRRPARDGRSSHGRSLIARLADFLSALRHRDFACVFAGRAAAIMAYYLVIGYELYILTDFIKLPGSMKPAQGVRILAVISAVGALAAAAVSGPLSDRLDRRKPFVFISSAVAGGGCILPVLSPTFPTIEIFAALAGIAFGTYLSVDAALITLVLPRGEDAARDLGVLNIANAGPQVLAPLIAAIVISHLGGYRMLFVLGGCCGIAAAVAIMPVRAVR